MICLLSIVLIAGNVGFSATSVNQNTTEKSVKHDVSAEMNDVVNSCDVVNYDVIFFSDVLHDHQVIKEPGTYCSYKTTFDTYRENYRSNYIFNINNPPNTYSLYKGKVVNLKLFKDLKLS